MSTPESNGVSPAALPDHPAPLPDYLKRLRLPHYRHDRPPVRNANDVHRESLSPLDKLAVKITDRVGSMQFFLLILTWTILWTGYNILADEVHALHWRAFDPFPAFVAYLLISNVIQILLMPLIMVGQNVQGRHTETRAELDFEVNQKAEREVTVILRRLEHNTELTLQLMRHLQCQVSEEDLRALTADPTPAAEPTAGAGAP